MTPRRRKVSPVSAFATGSAPPELAPAVGIHRRVEPPLGHEEPAAEGEVSADASKTRAHRLARGKLAEGIVGDVNLAELRRERKRAHVASEERRPQPGLGRESLDVPPREIEHRLGQVKPRRLESRLRHPAEKPRRAAGQAQHRPARLARMASSSPIGE